MSQMQRIALAARPQGAPKPSDFSFETGDVPTPGEGELLARTIWLSLDPYMRGRMDDAKSYAAPVPLGGTMEGEVVAEVVASNHPGFAVGDIVAERLGWASHGVSNGERARKIDPSIAPISTALGVLGMPGMTAWTGLNIIGEAKPGETAVISAASGAVGSLAGQLAKAKGMTAVGVAGGADKCAYVTEELGFDACLDHRALDAKALRAGIAEAAPQGVDVYFENVGGKTTEAVLPLMNVFGRISICGMIAWYSGNNLEDALPMPRAWRLLLTQRLKAQGFIVTDHWGRLGEFLSEVAPMVSDGRVKYRETVAEGLENAPAAFMELLKGGNFGKQLVRVGDDP
ncbi:MAG: NADP-dependent oxidoreductase [Pseudomonadota bacterium]